MTKKTTSTAFSELSNSEKLKQLNFVLINRLKIYLWKKGEKDKSVFEVNKLDEKTFQLSLYTYHDKEISLDETLYTFVIDGVNYFGKGVLDKKKDGDFILQADKLYKSERRSSYRLLTDPTYKVYVSFQIDETYIGTNKVKEIKSGKSQTGIFKDFLKLIEDEKEDLYQQEDHLYFRVNDLSVTGLSLIISGNERKFFDENKKIGQLNLNFEGQKLIIPNSMVIYILDAIKTNETGKHFKVGIQFLDIDTLLDQTLGGIINKALRNVEDEFEEFLD